MGERGEKSRKERAVVDIIGRSNNVSIRCKRIAIRIVVILRESIILWYISVFSEICADGIVYKVCMGIYIHRLSNLASMCLPSTKYLCTLTRAASVLLSQKCYSSSSSSSHSTSMRNESLNSACCSIGSASCYTLSARPAILLCPTPFVLSVRLFVFVSSI